MENKKWSIAMTIWMIVGFAMFIGGLMLVMSGHPRIGYGVALQGAIYGFVAMYGFCKFNFD